MGRPKKEIQREYRDRKRMKEGEKYLEKERERTKAYYKPISERSKEEVMSRREKVREWVRRHREKKKKEGKENEENSTNEIKEDQVNEVTSSDDIMIVKLPALQQKPKSRKRISRAVSKNHREMKKLKTDNSHLKTKYKTLSKRFERFRKRKEQEENERSNLLASPSSYCNELNEKGIENEEITPRKRTSLDLSEEGLTPRKVPKTIKQKLLLANVLTSEIHENFEKCSNREKSVVCNIIAGKLAKKYRIKKVLGMKTKIRRQRLKVSKAITDGTQRKFRNERKHRVVEKCVIEFLQRDDNSRVMPGKNDKVKTKHGYKQKRILNDCMKFLHMKFQSETSEKISLATFCRLRPKHISLTRFLSRNKCLCQKHQNMALVLKCMRNAGVNVPSSPDEFGRQLRESNKSINEIIGPIQDENLKLEQWKKVEMPDGKKKTKIVTEELTKDKFTEKVALQTTEFKDHLSRISSQYKAINSLKENLPTGHVIIQMDFAENYTCVSADEVQSAYWNSNSVTLHPVVWYYKDESNNLHHENIVYVSDDLGHNVGTVYAIIKHLLPEIRKRVPELVRVHYWTDSPSSQYRNKTAFFILSDHKNLMDVEAVWNYFETGHGKGPCDGVGGTAKRLADQAIKQGKICVQDANDFFVNVQTVHTSAKYYFVPSRDINVLRDELMGINRTLVPLKGTMKVHQVIGKAKGIVLTSTTSCYCQDCLNDSYHGRDEHNILKSNISDSVAMETDNGNEALDRDLDLNSTMPEIACEIGEWILAEYDNNIHVGQIKDVDNEDPELTYEVSFMVRTKGRKVDNVSYKWPVPTDILWIKKASVISKLTKPVPNGRSGRSFILGDSDQKYLNDLLTKRNTQE